MVKNFGFPHSTIFFDEIHSLAGCRGATASTRLAVASAAPSQGSISSKKMVLWGNPKFLTTRRRLLVLMISRTHGFRRTGGPFVVRQAAGEADLHPAAHRDRSEGALPHQPGGR